MASKLTVQAVWHDELTIIDPDDPVEGGEMGVDNIPHVELAQNDMWLKTELAKALERITALENKAPTTTDSSTGATGGSTGSTGGTTTGGTTGSTPILAGQIIFSFAYPNFTVSSNPDNLAVTRQDPVAGNNGYAPYIPFNDATGDYLDNYDADANPKPNVNTDYPDAREVKQYIVTMPDAITSVTSSDPKVYVRYDASTKQAKIYVGVFSQGGDSLVNAPTTSPITISYS